MEPVSALLCPPSNANQSPKLVFDKPVKAVTPGQMGVAYKGATVIAGGLISDENRKAVLSVQQVPQLTQV
jgi:tRNA-specific 2-thiouridylase